MNPKPKAKPKPRTAKPRKGWACVTEKDQIRLVKFKRYLAADLRCGLERIARVLVTEIVK